MNVYLRFLLSAFEKAKSYFVDTKAGSGRNNRTRWKEPVSPPSKWSSKADLSFSAGPALRVQQNSDDKDGVPQMSVEVYMTKKLSVNRNMLVPFYIMCCYAYYQQDEPLVSDAFFDRLATLLAKEFTSVQHHHKNYLSEDMVKAATYTGPYPLIIEGAVAAIRRTV